MRFNRYFSFENNRVEKRSSFFKNHIAMNKICQNRYNFIDAKFHMHRELKFRRIICCHLIVITKSLFAKHE